MESLVLGASSGSYSTFGIVIWVIVIALAIYAIRAIGRFSFGVGVFIAMSFFSIFMLDNFTNHDLRRYIDLRHYDQTLEDPQGKAEEIAGLGSDLGKDVVGKVDDVGATIDKEVGIERVEGSKEWGSKDKDSDVNEGQKEDSKKEKDSEKEESEHVNVKGTSTITYAEITKELKNDLDYLSKQDKAIIQSMSPTLKITLDGEQISVTNEETEDGYLTITLK